jgi:hypothetical protein
VQIILDNGTILTPRFALGEVVAMLVQTETVGVVVGVTVIEGGSIQYDVSVAGNPIPLFEVEIVETVPVDKEGEDA